MTNLMHKFLFYNKFIIFLYVFWALCAHHQEVKTVLYSVWYYHTETSEWSKITKIQFYKYEQIVKLCMNFSGVITVYFFTISMLCHVEVTVIQLLNLI